MSQSQQQQQQQQQQSSASSSSTAKGAAAPAASSSLDPLIRDLEGGIIVPGAPRPAGPLLKASSQPPSQPASTVTIHLPPSSSSAAIASPNTASNSTTSAKPTIGLAAAAATARARQQQQQRIPADNTGSTSAGPARRPFIPEAIPPAIRRLSTGAGSNSGSSSRSASALSNTSVQPSSGSAAASRFKGTPPRTTRYSLPVRAEKPVRSSKTTGKHIVLPSESQLAPLPLEEDDDEEESEEDSEEDDDDDDDDDDEDEEDESAEEGTVRAETSPDEKKVDDLVPPLPSAAGKKAAAVSEAAGVEVETQVPLSATPADPQRSRAAAALRVSQRRTGPTPAPRITPERSTTLPTLGHTRPLIKQPPSDLPPSALKRPTSAATAPSPLGPTSGAGPKGAVSATSPTTAYPNRIQQARFPPAHARAPPRYPKSSGPAYHTFERLLPAARVPTPLPRVTSFAIGTALHLPTLIGFLRREHGVKPRLYDECVYVVYVKPLLPGFGRANVRSAPEPKTGSPGGESRREREMEAREESGYVGSYFAARKEEREEIDPQGYIEEGQGREDDDRRQRERSERRGGSDGGAEAGGEETDGAVERSFETETETETEREKAMLSNSRAGAGPHIVVQSDEDEDEDDDDSALKRLVVTAQDEIQVEVGGITPDPSAPVSPAVIAVSAEGTSGNTSSSESTSATLTARTSASSGSSDDLDESGVATPRLGPRLDPGADQAIAFDDDGEAVRTPVAELISNPILNDGSALLYSPEAPLLVPLPELESPGAREGEEEPSAADQVEAPLADGEDVTMGDSTARTSKKRSSAATKSGKTRRSRKNRSARNKEPLPNLCSHNHDTSVNHLATREILEALQLAELIILPYGVLVMYNFSAVEERQVIEDIVSSGGVRGALSPEDEETEAFHFCYDPAVPAPRIFNDFFTFRAPNHLLKLSLAHAIAQSTKLSVFEESMQRTLELTSHIPKELANTGELKLKRREALRLTGRLFKLRVDVNLTSNVASVPELFWSHATLKALYDPIRDYLEIDQRVENLNERLAVANDLLEIIHEDIANKAMSNITLIIIILILVACIVACGEISARLILHNRATSAAAALRMLSSSSSSSTSSARAGLLLEAAAGAGAGAQKVMRVVPVKRMVTKSAAAWVRST